MNHDSDRRLIDKFVAEPHPSNMDALISAFRRPDLPGASIAYLATKMAHSGAVLNHADSAITADVPSTGGPSSLSTILCPLLLVSQGAVVPKLGVAGRPAGGIDVFLCVPGFRADLTIAEVERALQNCGYAHFLAGDLFCPLDATLFEYRKRVGAQQVPALVIASLLSKKISVGVKRVALDVRVAPFANFGEWDAARVNARLFINVAARLGIQAECWLTNASEPYQPYIGRGEALVALHQVLNGLATTRLAEHALLCRTLAESCLAKRLDLNLDAVKEILSKHLEQQGSSWSNFEAKVEDVLRQPTATIIAPSSGHVNIDLNALRRILTAQQALHGSPETPFPDPCGIVVKCDPAKRVERGELLAVVRAVPPLKTMTDELTACFSISEGATLRRAPERIS